MEEILYGVYMIKQLAHDICFVIIFHIQHIPWSTDQIREVTWSGEGDGGEKEVGKNIIRP